MPRRRKAAPDRKQAAPTWLAAHREAVRTWLRAGAVVVFAGIAVAIVLVVLGARTVQYVSGMDRFRADFFEIACNPGPSWIQRGFLREVRELASAPRYFSVLDGETVRRIHTGLKLHPWVREVVWVRTTYPNHVEARLRYREPVALVQIPGGWKIVDAASVILPVDPDNPIPARQIARCLKVVGVPATAPNEAGVRWAEPAVAAGAALAQILVPHQQHLKLETIDMSNLGGHIDARLPEITLLTAYDTRIAWGRPPGTDKPGEIAPGEKIERMLEYLKRFPDDYRHCDIDIRHWDFITRQQRRPGPQQLSSAR